MRAATRSPDTVPLSDATCSALQLANFWQDVARRLRPRAASTCRSMDMERFGVRRGDYRRRHGHAGFRELMRSEVDYTRQLFAEGLPLIRRWIANWRVDLDLFSRGGLEILRAIERQDYDVLSIRPVLSKAAQANAGCCARSRGNSCPRWHEEGGRSDGWRRPTPSAVPSPARKAKNFYYAFVALPAAKATPSALCTPSCARPMTWPTTSKSPA